MSLSQVVLNPTCSCEVNTVIVNSLFCCLCSGWCRQQTKPSTMNSSTRQTVTWMGWCLDLKSEISSSRPGCPLPHSHASGKKQWQSFYTSYNLFMYVVQNHCFASKALKPFILRFSVWFPKKLFHEEKRDKTSGKATEEGSLFLDGQTWNRFCVIRVGRDNSNRAQWRKRTTTLTHLLA